MSLNAALHKRDPKSLSSLAALFLQSIPSPSNEHPCAKAAGVTFRILGGTGDTAAMTSLRMQFPAILDAGMAFIARPRTHVEARELTKALKSAWNSCRCDKAQPIVSQVHDFAVLNPDPRAHNDPLWGLLGIMVPILADCVPLIEADMRNLSRANEKAIRANKRITWPMDLNAAMPFGPEASFKAVLAWSTIFEEPYLFKLILAVSNLHGPHISRPMIFSSPSVLSAFAKATQKAAQSWEHRPRDPTISTQAIKDLFHCSLFFCDLLLSADDSDMQRFASQVAEVVSLPLLCDQVVRLVTSHEDAILPFPGKKDCITTVQASFTIIGGRALALLKSTPDDLSKYHRGIIMAFFRHQSLPSESPYHTIYTHLMTLSRDGVCGARECKATTSSSDNRKFSVCSGCGVIPYCSKDCQKRGWKDIDAPHNLMCKKLRNFSEIALDGRKIEIQDPMTLQRKCQSVGIEGALTAEIAGYLRSTLS
ncbi:hypothetical protein CERSUDRAFT_77462 [Gelatoporia subvermispora B]|uniref:MYND-type domain-containing protein n=1 Tax=Ceriporiopsis subvermispora (strain B) TaxID=914234 RepID=M2PAE0_CERS8|nr:hypothetical protein CERSUDRAFT_77462 [Gelatoporia subvermispora B]